MTIGDNYDLWEQHDREQEAKLRKLPECSICGERIQQDRAVRIWGDWICDECLKECRENIGGY